MPIHKRKLFKPSKSKASNSTSGSKQSSRPVSKATSHPTPIEKYSRQKLSESLSIDAKALGIPPGSAEIFISKTLDGVEKSLGEKQIITERDLKSALVKELKNYHKDFAYIYQNRDKII